MSDNLQDIIKLGEEMGSTLSSKPYLKAKEIWSKVKDPEEAKALKERFYKAAESQICE